MPTGCSPCCIPQCREDGAAAVRTTSRAGYLETRRAATVLPSLGAEDATLAGASAALRAWAWCPPCCRLLAARRLSAAVTPGVTPATTVTTVTPCTPPPGAPGPAAGAAGPSLQAYDGDAGGGDGDRAFLDFDSTSASAPRRPFRRCGAVVWCCGCVPGGGCCGCVPGGACALSPARVSSLRDLEGRCCAVLAILTFLSMVVGLALFSDPLLLDLSTHLQRARCVTINYTILEGATNCTWASCRESCTTQAYKCPQIFVNYTLIGEGEAGDDLDEEEYDETVSNSTAEPAALQGGGHGGADVVPLQVNVAGCGLDAVKYSCTKFNMQYMLVGREFACEVALGAPWPVAVPEAVRAQSSANASAWLGGALPLATCVACVLYMRARRLFSVAPAAAPTKKRASLRPRGSSEPRSFYKRKMAEMDEWRRRRQQLVLAGPGRGSTASRVHGEGDGDELVSSEDQDEDDDLEDVVVGTVYIEPRPREDDDEEDDEDVAVEMCLPPAPPDSPGPPPADPPTPPAPPPCSPETSPPPTPDLVPLIVLDGDSSGEQGLRPIPEEPPLTLSPKALNSGSRASSASSRSPSWRGEPVDRPMQTVSGTVHLQQHYDISQ